MNGHYIPQFYQRQFVDGGSGLIWKYRPGQEPWEHSIRFTASKEDMYSPRTETTLHKRETKAGLMVSKDILKERSLQPAQRLEFATFMVSMQRRTPKFQACLRVRSEKHMRETLEDESLDRLVYDVVWDPQALLSETFERARLLRPIARLYREQKLQAETIEETCASWFDELASGDSSRAPEAIAKMAWTFLKAPAGSFFVTSDAPFDSRGLDQRERTYFPVSKTYALELTWKAQPESYREIRAEEVLFINRKIIEDANSEVYSGRRCGHIQQLVDEILSGQKKPA